MSLGGVSVGRVGLVVALTAIGLAGRPVVAAPAGVAATGRLMMSAGTDVTSAKAADGTARCWGNRNWGQLGNGGVPVTSLPVTVSGLAHISEISAGSRTTCAVLADRNVKCWGLRLGWHGFGSIPIPVLGFVNTIALSVGGSFVCAIRSGGQLRCMGWNYSGDLGDGDLDTHATPVDVLGITTAVAVSAGEGHACALLANGTVMCWGDNQSGEVGTGTISTAVLAPVAVRDISRAIAIAAGADHTCALLANRTVMCWGGNTSGQLGNGTVSNDSLSPVPVTGLHDVSAISAGTGFTCAVLKNGTAKCWGSNFFGTLGNGTTSDSSTPVAVHGITNAVGITTGSSHACVALADNSARCWGDNSYGKLGNHSQTASTLPVKVVGL